MKAIWKVVSFALLGFTTICAALVAYAAMTSDFMTKRQALERIMASDEPCTAAYTKMVDLRAVRQATAVDLLEAARTGEPVCRLAFKQLADIHIFIPKGVSDARDKKATIEDCAARSRARADILAFASGASEDMQRANALEAELDRTDRLCTSRFEQLARQ